MSGVKLDLWEGEALVSRSCSSARSCRATPSHSWRVWQTESSSLDCDASALYGEKFIEPLCANPLSAFVADGSAGSVRRGVRVSAV